MKNLYFLTLILSLMLLACEKKMSTPAPPPIEDTVVIAEPFDSTYSIRKIDDVSIRPFYKGNVVINVEKTTGIDRRVLLEVKDLPAGVTASFSTNDVYAPFSSTMEIVVSAVWEGTYQITVVARTDGYPPKEYKFNLTIGIIDQDGCNGYFNQGFRSYLTYTVSEPDTQMLSNNFTFGIDEQTKKAYLQGVLLSHRKIGFVYPYLKYMGVEQRVYINIDCVNDKIDIPAQKVLGVSLPAPSEFDIYGSGTINIPAQKYNIIYHTSFMLNGVEEKETYNVSGHLKYY